MLYLSRKIGESIIINNNIELTVMEVRGKTVKIGFNFPKEASILRKELHEKITEQNVAAANIGEQELMDISFDVNTKQNETNSDENSNSDESNE